MPEGATITRSSGGSSKRSWAGSRANGPGVDRPGGLRHRAAPGTRLRQAGRPGLDRQEYLPDRPQGRQLHGPRVAAGRHRAGLRRPYEANHCGTCTRCLDACPTDAFDGPYQLDARRVHQLLDDRAQGARSPTRRPKAWATGPSAATSARTSAPGTARPRPAESPGSTPDPEWVNPDLIEWLEDDPAAFARSLKGTALARSKRSGLLRNAALILGTRRVVEAVPVLIERLSDADPVVRGASAWALGRIGSPSRPDPLFARLDRKSPTRTARRSIARRDRAARAVRVRL